MANWTATWLNLRYYWKTIFFISMVCSAFLILTFAAWAHSERTNANGCHTNYSTGGYHCHTPKTRIPGHITHCHVINEEYRVCAERLPGLSTKVRGRMSGRGSLLPTRVFECMGV